MPISIPLQRIAYLVLGALPATLLTIPLLQNWRTYIASPDPQGTAHHVYFVILPACALLASCALWFATLAPNSIYSVRVKVAATVLLMAGLLAIAPWFIVFTIGFLLRVQFWTTMNMSTIVGELRFMWYIWGPILVAIHFLFLIFQGRLGHLTSGRSGHAGRLR